MTQMNTDAMDRRAQSLVRRIPVPVSFGDSDSDERIGTRAALNKEQAFELYGSRESVSQSVSFAYSEISDVWTPDGQDVLTVDGKPLRVKGYEFDSARVFVRIDLGGLHS